jgi:hypothetical protein
MERRWLMSTLAVLAVTALPAAADDKAPEKEKPAAPPTLMAMQGSPADKPVDAAKEAAPAPRFTYGFSADGYFSTNFNDPNPAFNGLGVFDFRDEHGPHLGLIEVWAQYARSPIGGRIDLDWGPTARIVNFAERPISGDDVWDHVQQAYLSFNVNKSGTKYIDVGRYVTPAGAEVIEPKDNWLYSRGILFGFAIPFTHTGIRYWNYSNDTDYVMLQVNRGWDTVSDPGSTPGFGITAAKAMNPKWTLIGTYLGGEEPGSDGDQSYRNLLDVVALYNPGGKIAYSFNGDFGEQQGDIWYGLSAMAKYTLDSKSYLAARAEFMADNSGFRFGSGPSATAYGFTVGYARNWNKYFQSRVEYRHDFADEDIFPDSGGRATDSQGRFIVSGILSY